MLIPIVRLFHVSDFHRSPRAWSSQALLQFVRAGGQDAALVERVGQLVQGHQARTWRLLEASLRKAVAQRRPEPARLLVTGDLSAWGDLPSMRLTLHALRSLAESLNLPPPIFLYGNHDLWNGRAPDGFPLLVGPRELEAHRRRMVAKLFPDWPQIAQNSYSFGDRLLRLVILDTAITEPHANSLALGTLDPAQIEDLRQPLNDAAAAIIATHHPLRFEDASRRRRLPILGLGGEPDEVLDAERVARQLRQIHPGNGPQLILSGHTHRLYPRHGHLADSLRNRGHLSSNQLQLVIGSATQGPSPEKERRGGTHENWWQEVALSWDPQADTLVVERVPYRNTGWGFEPLRAEAVQLPLSRH